MNIDNITDLSRYYLNPNLSFQQISNKVMTPEKDFVIKEILIL